MEVIEKEILQTLKRIESKIDNFEGFYTSTKDEYDEIKRIEQEMKNGEFLTLEELERELE
ncbi:MAG: hypothetical protein ACMXYB_00685 [Candidatus Woesearchaeota archaeon]